MKNKPIKFGINHIEKADELNEYIPLTLRHNNLSDIDFDIIADTIKCQNLKNQMNVRLIKLKKRLF